jgi:hypothetical protein
MVSNNVGARGPLPSGKRGDFSGTTAKTGERAREAVESGLSVEHLLNGSVFDSVVRGSVGEVRRRTKLDTFDG